MSPKEDPILKKTITDDVVVLSNKLKSLDPVNINGKATALAATLIRNYSYDDVLFNIDMVAWAIKKGEKIKVPIACLRHHLDGENKWLEKGYKAYLRKQERLAREEVEGNDQFNQIEERKRELARQLAYPT